MILITKQQGFLTIVTVVLIVIMSFLAVSIAYVFSNSAFITSNFQQANRALYLAESGLEQATRALLLPTIASRSACAGLSITNSSVAGGTYTITSTGPFSAPNPGTTLSSAITDTTTNTLAVVSTTGYPTSGRVMVDREFMTYTATNATNFLNVTRGVDSSVATTHADGTSVGQYQCQLTSTGGSPTATYTNPGDPGGVRILNEAIQLQEAWAVGNTPSLNFNFAHFNNPTERTWVNAAVTSSTAINLNSISMLSYDDGWAVGTLRTFLHWNGNVWTAQTPAAIPSVTMSGIFCNASNDCHAVGANSGGAVLGHWNGSAWSRLTPTNSTTNSLTSVNCDAANDCWAVGNNTGTQFYQWNGSTWTGVVVSTLTGFTFNHVFCNTSTDCWAVGATNVFARKNGATWANASATERGTIPSAQYNSVYCVSSSDCWAVGNVNTTTLLVHWNGTSWARYAPSPTPAVNLMDVACANTNDCWAVGNTTSAEGSFFHWNGTTWVNVAVSGIVNAQLNSIAMISPNTQPWSVWAENFS